MTILDLIRFGLKEMCMVQAFLEDEINPSETKILLVLFACLSPLHTIIFIIVSHSHEDPIQTFSKMPRTKLAGSELSRCIFNSKIFLKIFISLSL